MFTIKMIIKSAVGFYITVALILGVIVWGVIRYVGEDLKWNLVAEIIGVALTVIVIGSLLRLWYPPTNKTISKFLLPQLDRCLFSYVCDMGFLLGYSFNNDGFKGMSPIDLSTYRVFLKNNLFGVKQKINDKKDTLYTVAELKKMSDMFRSFSGRIDQFIARYANHLSDDVLVALYEIRHICDYQSFCTAIPLTIDAQETKINMGRNISNEPMEKVLNLIEEIVNKAESQAVVKSDPLPI